MSESNNSLREELIENRDAKEYRHAYADENLNATIATQIKVLREQREWKQEDLAKEAGMKQPMISRYENVNYSSWSINTLKKLAEAFDVYLDVRFRSFQELVDLADHFGREILQVPPFTEDPFFQEAADSPEQEEKLSDTGAHGNHTITASTGSLIVSVADVTLKLGSVENSTRISPQITSTEDILDNLSSGVSPVEKTATGTSFQESAQEQQRAA